MKSSGKYLDNFYTQLYVAAIEGKSLHKFVNEKVIGTTDPTAIDDATMYYDLEVGEQVIITGLYLNLATASDDARIELGWTDQIAAAGTFTAIGHHFETASGAANAGAVAVHEETLPPRVIKYSSGARCVTMRVIVNDNAAEVTAGWHGFRESEK